MRRLTVDDNRSKGKEKSTVVTTGLRWRDENRPSMATGLKEREKSTVHDNWSVEKEN